MRIIRGRLGFVMALATLVVASVFVGPAGPPEAAAAGPCDAPIVNPVACENTKTGVPSSQWDVSGSGSAALQGFSTDISVNRGGTVRFKVDTTASRFRIDIYRMGYYGGAGARAVGTVLDTETTPRDQPSCLNNATTGLVDCGNWSESAAWAVPGDAVSGVYLAKLVRTDGTAGSSHVAFVVRDDASRSSVLFQTSDTTWQAYNQYGGNSLYTGSPAGRAYKVSYNRPFTTRGSGAEDWVFNAEYPMVRWLEANGYDVSYTTGVDSDRRGGLIQQHKTFLSVGHDEYWSGGQRANVEAARDAGVNLAFFSGNEVFWKTRWESAIDGSGTSYRTLVSYKETHANAKIDPQDPPTWTGTWRDPRFSPPADGGRPENALTGTAFEVNCCTTQMSVTGAYRSLRFWRGTRVASLAPTASTQLGTNTLGYEWDEDPDNGSRPAGLVPLSSTTVGGMQVLQDYGSSYGNGSATHSLTLYRAASGALVFGAGTVQWSWGLDGSHDNGSSTPDTAMQQATVNLFADMGAQPATIRSGLTPATASTDTTKPVSTITAPAAGGSVPASTNVTITGTASDVGGVVGAVEVSTDGGSTWHRAGGTATWSYTWRTPSSGVQVTLKTRAADDSGWVETPGAGTTVTVGGGSPVTCPCSLWSAGVVPANPAEADPAAVEIGTKFRADRDGYVTAVRYYKGTGNTGTHVAHVWTSTGTLLATATYTNETTTGWQQVSLPSPVAVTAATTYIASYYAPAGRYAADEGYFATSSLDNGPLSGLRDGQDGPNGVYSYGALGGFPSSSYASTSYYVDPVFTTSVTPPPDTTPPTVTSRTPAAGATGVALGTTVSAVFSEPLDPTATISLTLQSSGGTGVAGTQAYAAASRTVTFSPSSPLTAGTTYSATVSGAKDTAGNTMTADTWSFTTSAPSACPCSLFASTARPGTAASTDRKAVEVGVRFRADTDGFVTGVRFYKGTGNSGTHLGRLWTNTGTRLASATFTGETSTGWQQVTFSSPVAVTAGTTYVASYYAPVGRYSEDEGYFATAGVDRVPLHAPADAVGNPNGVYRYGSGGGFPTSTYRSTNYWVDVVFTPTTG